MAFSLQGGFCHQNRKLTLSSECGRKGPILLVCWSGPKPCWGEKPSALGEHGEFPTAACALAGCRGGRQSRTPRAAPLTCFLPAPAQVDIQGGQELLHVHSQCALPPHAPSHAVNAPSRPGRPQHQETRDGHFIVRAALSSQASGSVDHMSPEADTCKISHRDMEPHR